MFYDASHADEILSTQFDYVVDAIDCVTSKINLVEECNKRNIPIINFPPLHWDPSPVIIHTYISKILVKLGYLLYH